MLFSSLTFLYYFMPAVLLLYFIAPMRNGSPRLRNWVLLAASVFFYAWGEPVYVLLMLGQAFSGWFFGLLIERFRGRPASRAALAGSIAVGIGGLVFFKYSDFFIGNANALFRSAMAPLGLALPIGISFYTFQILSYTIDLYRGDAGLQGNFFTFSAYVMLFPQLIAGPIVRYVDVEKELARREHTMARFAQGARRFVLGLGKKVLIANVLGELVDIYKKSGDRSALFAWLYIVAYALHIYFDFSGYSDMAIGMGHMFGFHFHENFNYPYISRSVTEFWRRWHISLSTWFRDYVYIPLGGSRVSAPRYVFNIIVVWFLTGFWHGAGWNFIVWGLYFAALLMLEKYVVGKALARLPAAVPHAFALLCALVGWVFFDAADLRGALSTLSVMFGAGGGGLASAEAAYYLRSYLVPLLVAAVGCTPLPSMLMRRLFAGSTEAMGGEEAVEDRLADADADGDSDAPAGAAPIVAGAAGGAADPRARAAAAPSRAPRPLDWARLVLEPLGIAVLLIVVTAYLVDGSFNPFIYFRF
jgi:alginate O-acetyltransferase complex protein AlgI